MDLQGFHCDRKAGLCLFSLSAQAMQFILCVCAMQTVSKSRLGRSVGSLWCVNIEHSVSVKLH